MPVDAATSGRLTLARSRLTQCARCGMSAHPRDRAIMNNHATRLGLAGVDESGWNSSCARK
jgi:hypothetical protein